MSSFAFYVGLLDGPLRYKYASETSSARLRGGGCQLDPAQHGACPTLATVVGVPRRSISPKHEGDGKCGAGRGWVGVVPAMNPLCQRQLPSIWEWVMVVVGSRPEDQGGVPDLDS